jgi:hypothetical protein
MTIATGVSKNLAFKKQTGLGVKAPGGAATGQLLRRVTSNLSLKKATYSSNELRPSQQKSDFRHGVWSVEGTVNGEVSVGTYQAFEESLLRAAASAAPSTGAIITVGVAPTSGSAGTFTRSGGSFLTDGFKVGMVARASGYTTTGVTVNGVNLFITAVAALTMSFVMMNGGTVPTKAAGDSVTILAAGKYIAIPSTAGSQTRDYYTMEHNFSDIKQSEQFVDCVVSEMSVKLPGSGMATVDFNIKGLDQDTTDYSSSGTAYFTSPTAASNGAILASSNGLLYLNGAPVALVTGLNFSVKGNHTDAGGVVGSNFNPDIFPGPITVDGQVTVLFQDAAIRDLFVNETEFSMYAMFTADNTSAAAFKAYSFPRCKMSSADKDDGNKSLVMTMGFTALENINGGTGLATHSSTVVIQDSAFA